jgi:hypothetical protein
MPWKAYDNADVINKRAVNNKMYFTRRKNQIDKQEKICGKPPAAASRNREGVPGAGGQNRA